jgi:hypothetical protein
MSAQGAPVRNLQNIPFNTQRSSTRFTPRTFVGSKGSITDHSKSVRSKRAISSLLLRAGTESNLNPFGNPIYGYVT